MVLSEGGCGRAEPQMEGHAAPQLRDILKHQDIVFVTTHETTGPTYYAQSGAAN